MLSIDHTAYAVTIYTREKWSDAWTTRADLEPLYYINRHSPHMPTAVFRYRYGDVLQPGSAAFSSVSELDVLGHFVKVTVTYPAASGATTGDGAKQLIDAGADFDDIQPGTPVFNTTASTYTTVDYVDSSTTLQLMEDIFDAAENYSVGGERTAWIGFMPEDQNLLMDEDTGVLTLHAVGLEALLDRVTIHGCVAEGMTHRAVADGTTDAAAASQLIDSTATFDTDGVLPGHIAYNVTDDTTTTVVTVDSGTQLTVADDIFANGEDYEIRPPTIDRDIPFNVRHPRGSGERGNRSDDADGDGVHQFSTDGALWSWYQIIKYLLKYFGPMGITFASHSDNVLLNLAITRSFDPYGLTTRQALNRLCHTYGLCWRVMVERYDFDADETVRIIIRTQFKDDITIGDFTYDGNQHPIAVTTHSTTDVERYLDVTASVMRNQSQTYDVLQIQGARIKACFTAGYKDNTLEPAWANALETSYLAALGAGSPGDANDRYRKQPKYDGVFTRFRIPSTWDGTVSDGAGGATENIFPGVKPDGTIDWNLAGAVWNGHLPLCRELPLKEHVDYGVTPHVDHNPSGAEPEYRRPIVWLKYGASYYLAHDLKETGLTNGSCSVRVAGREAALEVNANPPHLLAKNHWAGAQATDVDPEFDYEDMVAVLAVELPQRPYRQVVLNQNGTKKKIITVDECEFHVASGKTAVYTGAGGALKYITGGRQTLRDDTEVLKGVAAAAQAWYGTAHNALVHKRARLSASLRPGVLVTTVDRGGGNTVTVNSVVSTHATRFHYAEDGVTVTTTVTTGLADVDFTQFAHMDNRSLGGPNAARIATRLADLEKNDAYRLLHDRRTTQSIGIIGFGLSTGSATTGTITLHQGSGIDITRDGNDITITNTGVLSIAKQGEAQITGHVTVTQAGIVTITQAGQNLEISATEADTLDAVCDRGASTDQTITSTNSSAFQVDGQHHDYLIGYADNGGDNTTDLTVTIEGGDEVMRFDHSDDRWETTKGYAGTRGDGDWIIAGYVTGDADPRITIKALGGGKNALIEFGDGTTRDTVLYRGGANLLKTDDVFDAVSGFQVNGSAGIDGWADDGANFRVTFTKGLVTAVANSTAGGHS